jgi:iron complex outermembrane receptor protein
MSVNTATRRVFPRPPQLCRRDRPHTRALLVIIIASGWTGAARAESVDETAVPSSNSPGELHEVVVSARRHEERLENVPVSVSALSADALAEQKVMSEADLQSATPGLTVRQVSASNQFSFALRGQAADAFSGTAPTVLTYFNEFQSSGTTSTAFFDLQSVQVLKGPQGTLFGRNTTGGAVLYEAVRPGRQLDGYLRLSGGNYSEEYAEGAINLPFGDVAALRLAGEYQKRDGLQHNLLLGMHPDSIDEKNGRASLLLTPTEQLENLTTFQYGKYGGYNAALRISNAYPVGSTHTSSRCIDPSSPGVCHLNTTAAELYGPPGYKVFGLFPSPQLPGHNGILDFINKQRSQGFYDVSANKTGAHDADQKLVVNKTTYTFSKAAVLKNIAGYNKILSRDSTDEDGSPYQLYTVSFIGGPGGEGHTYDAKQYSEELQLSGVVANDRLNYILGGYYGRDDEGTNLPVVIGLDFVPIIGQPISRPFRVNFENHDMSRAGYFQGSYEMIPGMHVTAGFRETWENVTIIHRRGCCTTLPDDLYALAGVPNATQKLHKPSWTVGLDYQVTPETLLYVTQRGSYRAGGFNGISAVPNPANPAGPYLNNEFKPETTWDVEIGAKFAGKLGGMPARFTVAVYDQTVKDIQRVVYFGIAGQTSNARKARTTGVEVEGQLDLARWLQAGVSYAYTNARFIDGHGTVVDPAGVIHSLILGPLGDTPKQSGSAYVRVVKELPGERGELVVRGDVFAQSDFFYTNLADSYTPDTRIGGYSLMNLRLEWNDIFGSKISVAGWGRNLADKQYLVGGQSLGAVVGINTTLPGVPRTYGADVFVKF